jgi:hypothetical protein
MLHPETASDPPTKKESRIRGNLTSKIIECIRFESSEVFKKSSKIAPGVEVCEGPIKSEASITGNGKIYVNM